MNLARRGRGAFTIFRVDLKLFGMRNGCVLCLAQWLTASLLIGAPPAPAPETGETPGMRPVDQAVGDLDPLSVSLRQVGRGLRVDGEHSSLFRFGPDTAWDPWRVPLDLKTRGQPPNGGFYRIGPGFRARVDRIDYLVRTGPAGLGLNVTPRRDGEFIERIPANTVFELTPPPTAGGHDGSLVPTAIPSTSTPIHDSRRLQTKISHRVDLRYDGRVWRRAVSEDRLDRMRSFRVAPKDRMTESDAPATQPRELAPKPHPEAEH